MNRPFLSFAIALMIWILLLVIFYLTIFEKSKAPPVSLVIDATVVSGIEQQQKKSPKDFTKQEVGAEKSPQDASSEANIAKAQQQAPLFSPLPKIPDDLREEAFKSFAVVRFHIAEDGVVVSVDLIHPCANMRLNQLLLNSLKSWKFVGLKKAYTQDVRVNFEVE